MSPQAPPARRLLRYLALPAWPAGLLLIAVLALCFALCQGGGLIALPGQILLLYWTGKYSYVLLEQVAHGAREPPVLSIEMLNPAAELRPLLQLALVGAVALALHALERHLGSTLTLGLDGLALAALPASIAALGIGAGFWQVLNPLALWHIVRALGLLYPVIVAVALAYAAALAWASVHWALPGWLLYGLILFAWLSVYALIGGCLYEARDALGHDAMYSPERAALRRDRPLEQDRTRFVDGVYAQARSGNLRGAWTTIERELAAQGHGFETYDWLLERLSRLDDQRLASRLAQDDIRRALARDNARVTRLARARLALDAQFRPYSALETLRVAELLRLAGDRTSAQRLLADFAQQFPEAPAELQARARTEGATLAGHSP